MKKSIRALAVVAILVLPAQGFAAENLLLAQQGPYPPDAPQGQQGQQPGTPHPGGFQQQGQQQGMPPQGGAPGNQQQPRPPKGRQPAVTIQPPAVVIQPPAVVIQQPGMTPPPPPPPPGRSPNRQYNAVLRCNQRQASCSQNCNRRTYGQARNICNNQCNAAFVNCTTRANGLR